MSIQLKLKSTLKDHSNYVCCLTRYNDLLVSGSHDRTIKLWNGEGKCISTFNANNYVSCLTVFKDVIISGEFEGIIKYWNSSTGKCIKSIKGHGLYICSLIVVNNLLYSGGDDGTIMVWTEDGECIHTIIRAHSNYVSCLIGYKDMLISGSYDKTIKCWSLSSYDCIVTLEGHSNNVVCLAVYDNYLLSGSLDKTMKLWKGSSSSCCIRTFQHEGYVMSILVVGVFIITGDSGGKMYIWSLEGNLLESVQVHSDWIRSLVIHQNHIYSGSFDNTIKKWSFSYLKMKKQALLAFNVMKTLKDVDEDMKLCLFLIFFLNSKNILSVSQLNAILDHACSATPVPDSLFLPFVFFPKKIMGRFRCPNEEKLYLSPPTRIDIIAERGNVSSSSYFCCDFIFDLIYFCRDCIRDLICYCFLLIFTIFFYTLLLKVFFYVTAFFY